MVASSRKLAASLLPAMPAYQVGWAKRLSTKRFQHLQVRDVLRQRRDQCVLMIRGLGLWPDLEQPTFQRRRRHPPGQGVIQTVAGRRQPPSRSICGGSGRSGPAGFPQFLGLVEGIGSTALSMNRRASVIRSSSKESTSGRKVPG